MSRVLPAVTWLHGLQVCSESLTLSGGGGGGGQQVMGSATPTPLPVINGQSLIRISNGNASPTCMFVPLVTGIQ